MLNLASIPVRATLTSPSPGVCMITGPWRCMSCCGGSGSAPDPDRKFQRAKNEATTQKAGQPDRVWADVAETTR